MTTVTDDAELVAACERVAAHPDWRTARSVLARLLAERADTERPATVTAAIRAASVAAGSTEDTTP